MNITADFIIIVTLIAILYAGLVRYLQFKTIDRNRMKGIQKELNAINKEYLQAMKAKNEKRTEELQKEQQKLMPEFNKMMMSQMKMMVFIIVIFLGFMWVVGQLDPNTVDDVEVEFTLVDGEWCGEIPLSGEYRGPWLFQVTAYSGGGEKGQNGTIAYYENEAGILPTVVNKGDRFPVWSDKRVYSEGETALICALPPAGTDRVVGKTNSGTWFMVELPFTLPIFNTSVINEAYWWFIAVSIVAGIVLSLAMRQFDGGKDGKKKG